MTFGTNVYCSSASRKTRQAVLLCQGLLTKIRILQHPSLALHQTTMAAYAFPISKFVECKLFIMISIWSNCVWKQIHKSIF